jgi:L-lactate dehydrogenase (cytochrome)
MTRTFHSFVDVRRTARRRLPRMLFDFVDGGADGEVTLRRNEDSLAAISLRPHVLVDVGRRDLTTTVVGQQLTLPVILGPAGLQGLMHRAGEPAAARCAHEAGTVYVLSAGSSHSLEDVRAATPGPLWFQLYLWGDRAWSEAMVARVADAGFSALCLTVDTPVGGRRVRDLRNGMSIPFRVTPSLAWDAITKPRWLPNAYANLRTHRGNFPSLPGAPAGALSTAAWTTRMMNPSATWEELKWLRARWPGDLVVKGILSPDDARRAVDEGADAIVVSNHGGRQLDGTPATIDALPGVVAAVGDQADVLIDGGFRRGSDVVKALALGARACLVVRPYLFGLATGPEGPRWVLELLREEIDTTLALLGASSVASLDPSYVEGATRSEPPTSA